MAQIFHRKQRGVLDHIIGRELKKNYFFLCFFFVFCGWGWANNSIKEKQKDEQFWDLFFLDMNTNKYEKYRTFEYFDENVCHLKNPKF